MNNHETKNAARPVVDFDHDSPWHAQNTVQEYKKMRETCPMAWTDKHEGFWVATRYEDIVAIAQRKEEFTPARIVDVLTGEERGGVTIPPPPFRVAPNETDLPEWQGVRGFLNRHFSPKAVELRRPRAKQMAAALIDEVIEQGHFDIVETLATPLPAMMTMEIIGFPLDKWEVFADTFHKMVYVPKDDPQYPKILRSVNELGPLLEQLMTARRAAPKDDLMSCLVHGSIDDQPIADDLIREMVYNVLGGGLDTTTALTSNVLLYLSRNPDDRRRLIDNPTMRPLACEEFVRYFSPVQALARTAKADAVVDGCPIGYGERILLAYASGNRDAAIFEDPDLLKLDRYPNRHIGFGAGMHRCMGSFLARMMFDAMLNEVLSRIPDYQVEEDKIVPYTSRAHSNGWVSIPATFTPGLKVGTKVF